ncbi:hypothetical protein RJ640_000618 [Escallonia rubra]|uniref:Receptor ligand binding region domain-containing protein n=1 Tax=Escallonia rubra TaxID=112253 RepID=A0AA88QEK6_9ASTE|nr:hypothetical protein RJ640_000618 [Escallonia rubra]
MKRNFIGEIKSDQVCQKNQAQPPVKENIDVVDEDIDHLVPSTIRLVPTLFTVAVAVGLTRLLHFKPTFSTSAAREMDEIIVSNSKVDLNLHSPTAGGGQQDIVGSTLPVSPYFIQMASDDSSRVQVMIKIIQGFGWHEVVVLRQDTKYHKRFALSLEDAFLGAKIKIVSNVSLSVSAKDLEIAEKLDKLKAMQTRVFLVYMVPLLRSRVLILAKTAGIMNEGYTWLIMDGVSNTSKSFQYNNLDSGKVLLPRRDSPPRLTGRTHFKSECDKLSGRIKSGKATGEVFCAALQIFPYKVEPEFVPLAYHNCEASQNYSGILNHVGQVS